jgi:hypothetical protein
MYILYTWQLAQVQVHIVHMTTNPNEVYIVHMAFNFNSSSQPI